ncbi:STAM-binding protein-like [Anopheles bellator]|uniref:STAM-binding protein-like n=1 Tax=Anopheles bellator TaxID=139047 RepID=UPI002648D3F8|nr:STAM-binding protein-like [Anopheles bellator]
MALQSPPVQVGAMEPHLRLQKLVADSQRVSIDSTMPINRYYRSGSQIVETADRSLREGNFEKAFTFYLRYVTIFVELILKHPGYRSVLPHDKNQTKTKIKEILPKAENIRAKLLERYEGEYQLYLQQIRLEENKLAEERARTAAEQSGPSRTPQDAGGVGLRVGTMIPSAPSHDIITDPESKLMEQVLYPSEFITGESVPSEEFSMVSDPSVDRSLKPKLSHSTGPATAGATGYRSITVPMDTLRKFLALTAANTAANLETCAILAGCLRQAKFVITHVIFPKQTGTSDSCNTMYEEEIAIAQDQHNLITLGWIHTHPSQTAFLSSVDLHTHCSYQLMLEEAIAIVCSPKYHETGFFNLTPAGMDAISQCRQTGFHPHSAGPSLFGEAQHVILNETDTVEVIDLR